MTSSAIEINSLDAEARGVGRLADGTGAQEKKGKVIFVDNALPGERVIFSSYHKKSAFEQAHLVQILRESHVRVTPACPHFKSCGGCSMQHIDSNAQLSFKQRILEDNLWHIAKLKAEQVLPPIHGPDWAYRYRARLAVSYLPLRNEVLVGFHKRKSNDIADITQCLVLPKHVSDLLLPLRALINSLSIREHIPHIEFSIGDSTTALVVRHLKSLKDKDSIKLQHFSDEHYVQIWLQSGGPETVELFYPKKNKETELSYTLSEFNIKVAFKPTDFTQINQQVNQVLVKRAIHLMQVQPQERVLDLFCGSGNFALPLGRLVKEVIGIEGSQSLVQRAKLNAQKNYLSQTVKFFCQNLFKCTEKDLQSLGAINSYLLDPPREGAIAVIQSLIGLSQHYPQLLPKRIVYVSCNPATLARDAGLLVSQGGYQLKQAGIVNMFPQTSHVESIALFVRKE